MNKIVKFLFTAIVFCGFLSGCQTPEDRAKETTEVIDKHHYIVRIQGMLFSPADLLVSAGDTVTWINQDIVEHNVTEELTKEWASPNLPNGASWSKVVIKPATYLCTLHPMMKGSLSVK